MVVCCNTFINMLWCVLLLCCVFLPHQAYNIPDFHFCMSSKRNQTGNRYYEPTMGITMIGKKPTRRILNFSSSPASSLPDYPGLEYPPILLEHDDKKTDYGVWDVNVHQSTIQRAGDKSFVVIAKITPPPTDDLQNMDNDFKTKDCNCQTSFGRSDDSQNNMNLSTTELSRNISTDWELPPVATIPLNETELANRRHGYVQLERLGHYKVHTRRKNWQNALETCKKEGAHLLVLNSEEEMQSVGTLMEKKGTAVYSHWIGFHNHFTGKDFVTIFNETLQSAGYVKWAHNEPNHRKGENCGMFLSQQGLGDLYCTWDQPFICEYN